MREQADELKLIDELNKASYAYYNSDTPIMSDQEFDIKLEELRQLEEKTGLIYSNSPTQNVGAPVLSSLNKISITPKPMLSLDKCHTAKEIENFVGKKEVIASIKCDGVSVRLKYNNGKLISANTRGDGYTGTDITKHVKYFKNVPLQINYTGEYIIDGEAIIKYDDFEYINKNNEFKNPRNTVAGTLNTLDMSIVKNRLISFYAWEVIMPQSSYRSQDLIKATSLGFTCSMITLVNAEIIADINLDNINKEILKYAEQNFIPCDGVVWKYNDIKYGESLGNTMHHPKDSIAWKPEVTVVETSLCGIQWQLGRTGVITPVARFDPVELDGSIIERASLHNYSVMRKVLGDCAYPGERLKIIKANMIIPQIIEAYPHFTYGEVIARGGVSAHDTIEKCPVCGGEVNLKESADGVLNYWCENPGCEGKLINRLDHYCGKKGLDIKGLSKATLEKLVEWDWIENIIDIYNLSSHKEDWVLKNGFGEKSVEKILSAIKDSQKNVELPSFISAIGIPFVGQTVAKEICKHVNSYQDFRDLIQNNFKFYNWDTFGPVISDNILNYNYEEADKIAKLLSFKEKDNVDNNLNGLNIVITGSLTKFKNRDELKKAIESRGGKVVGSISSKTNYLINNDIESTSSKNLSAKKLGIPIISEKDFIATFLTQEKK